MKLVSKKTGELVEIPDAEVQGAFRSGLFGIPKGAVAPVAAGDQVGTVSGDQFQGALESGARVPTEQEFRQAQAENTSAIGAAAAGAARGFGSTFGAPTDSLATDLGALFGQSKIVNDPYKGEFVQHGEGRAREQLNQWLEAHPYASMGGEMAGIGLSAYLTGGGSLARTGALAEGMLPQLGSRAVNALMRGTVRGAAEGGMLGGVQAVNEAALGDTKMNAEKLFAGIGHGAVFGGAAGGAFSALGLAAGEARDGAGKFLRSAGPKDIESVAEKQFGEAAEGLGAKVKNYFNKASASASGKDADTIAKFTDLTPEAAEARKVAVFEGDNIRNAAAKTIREEGDAMLRANTLVSDEARGALKREHVAKAVIYGNEGATRSYAAKTIESTLAGVESELTSEMAPQMIKSAETVSKAAYRVQQAIAKGADNAELFSELDQFKRSVQRLTANGNRSVRNIADPIDQLNAKRTLQFFDRTASELRSGLEDTSLWGEAATNQRTINEAWTRQIDASKRFHNALTVEVGRDPSNPYMQMRGLDPSKVDTYVKSLVNPNKDLTHQAVKDYLESTHDLAKAIKTSYDLPASKMAEVDRIEAAATKMTASMQKAEKALTLVNQFRDLTGTADASSSVVGAVLGGMGGGVLGGGIGAAVGGAVNALRNPAKIASTLAAVERIAAKNDSRIGRAVASFLSGGKTATKEVLEDATPKGFDKAVASIREASSSPEVAAKRVEAALGDLPASAPKLATATTMKVAEVTRFLATKIPVGMRDSTDFFVGQQPPMVSDTERDTFARYVKAATDPASVVERMAKGDITPEEVDTLKAVYPQMYSAIQARVRDEVLAHQADGKQLPYDKRVTLGVLFDVPTDASMQPEVRQAVAAAMLPSAGGGGGKKGKGGSSGGAAHIKAMPDRSLNALTSFQSVSFGGKRK